MSIKPVCILVSGGTFDKEYDLIKGDLYFKTTHLPEMLETGRCSIPARVQTLMMIDSLLMRAAHRALIADACTEAPEGCLIITHGTDTMVETAAYLANKNIEKTIVLTGAMIPYSFGTSDGFFNLGNALAYVQTLPHGVYVVMNGRAFPWDNVIKNKQSGIFEPLKPGN
jgi:L-asparaginase